MYLKDGIRINLESALDIDGVQYPPGFFLNDPDARQQAGIDYHPDPVRPDEKYYFVDEGADGSLNVSERPFDSIVAVKAQEIAASRFLLETSGVELNGTMIRTDRESQAMIASALMRVSRNPAALIDWKGQSVWVQIGAAEVEAIADAVGDHVQACFTAERVRQEALAAVTDFNELVAFDTSIGIDPLYQGPAPAEPIPPVVDVNPTGPAEPLP